MPEPGSLKGCSSCGLVQRLPELAGGSLAKCVRCGTTLVRPGARRGHNRRAFAAALAGLILYPLAIGLPIMSLERFGYRHEASIWSGSLELLSGGHLLVGLIVFLASVVIPLCKLIGVLAITGLRRGMGTRTRARTYRVIELAGRWGMLDVLLISVVVAWVKVRDLVEVEPGPGISAFTACVLLSLLAAAWFDPHALWEETRSA
jgi:paraquat-inducible protein A